MRKSDVVIGVVPTDIHTSFFVKDRKLPVFEIEYGSENAMYGTFGDITLPELSYEQVICLAALFEAVADWIKPETPKKVKAANNVEIIRTGWMAPSGGYYPVDGKLTHHSLANQLWDRFCTPLPRSPETWATAQTDLMRLGWLRFDYSDVTFMRRPTETQVEVMERMLAWKMKNPKEWTTLDLGAFEKMQRICQWIQGDAVEDYQDLEDEIEKNIY